MFMGVPLIPLFLTGAIVFLCAIYFALKILFLLPVAIIIMQAMVRVDEQIFDLLGLKLRFVFKTIGNPKSDTGDLLVGPHKFDDRYH